MSTLENKQQKPQLVTLEQLTQKLVAAVKKASPAERAEMRRNLYAQLGVKP
jgi:hypothetical protein